MGVSLQSNHSTFAIENHSIHLPRLKQLLKTTAAVLTVPPAVKGHRIEGHVYLLNFFFV